MKPSLQKKQIRFLSRSESLGNHHYKKKKKRKNANYFLKNNKKYLLCFKFKKAAIITLQATKNR